MQIRRELPLTRSELNWCELVARTTNDTDQVISKYEYNELGQLVDKKLHKKADGNYLQSIDLRYNIRGWLTNINNSKLSLDAAGDTNDDSDDIFGLSLLYNTQDASLGNTKYYMGMYRQ